MIAFGLCQHAQNKGIRNTGLGKTLFLLLFIVNFLKRQISNSMIEATEKRKEKL